MTDSSGMIVLLEYSGDNPTGKFYLDKSFRGFWSDSNDEKMTNVNLRETYPSGSYRFEGNALSAILPWKVEMADSPAASVDAFWLDINKDDASENIQSEINRRMVRFAVGDSAYFDNCCADMPKAFQYLRNKEFGAFMQMSDSNAVEDSTLQGYAYNTSLEVESQVLYNDRHLLGLGYYTYYYSGGAMACTIFDT
ncbi:MAG: hypothetical protein IPL65_10475 [Lewinellaceae bacterium]|nr:hypothetical protein [Lewinellaceae bacterium]